MTLFHQVLYTSESSAPLGATGISELLVHAREKNRLLEITGILTYHNRRFMQLLEGTQWRVAELYATIERDPRHHSIEILFDGTTPHRAFGRWTMGYFNLGDYAAHEIADFEQFVDAQMEALRTSRSSSHAKTLYDMLTKMLLGGSH